MSDQTPPRWNEPGASPFTDLPPASAQPPPPRALPVPVASASGPEGILLQVGDIGVSANWVVTPNGSAPLAGSVWIGRDLSRTEKKTPSWAIVIAVIGFWLCLIPLLFLMVKEEVTTGYFEVSVQSGTVRHVTQLPVSNQYQLAQYRQLVHQAQSMAAGHR